MRLRAGAFGYFLPLPWEAVFAGDAADRWPFRDTDAEPPDGLEAPDPLDPLGACDERSRRRGRPDHARREGAVQVADWAGDGTDGLPD